MTFLEVTVFMTYFGQRCVNVYNVVTTDTPAAVTPSFGALQAMGFVPTLGVFPADKFFANMKGPLSNQVVFNQVRIKNPYNDLDFISLPYAATVTGGTSGEATSPLVAYSIFSNQTRLDIQAGQKRFVGVNEANVDSGGIVNSAQVAALQDLCDIMSAPMTYDDEGNLLSYRIVVAKKFTDLEADPPIINGYFPTLELQMANVAQTLLWTPRAYVSSQTTRQYGRGR